MAGRSDEQLRTWLAVALALCTIAMPIGGAARYAMPVDEVSGASLRLGAAAETDLVALLLLGAALVLAATAGALTGPAPSWRLPLAIISLAALTTAVVLAVAVYDVVGQQGWYEGTPSGRAIDAARLGLGARFALGAIATAAIAVWTMRAAVRHEDGARHG